ncbi:MAG TPA: WGR domain-containing protein, partial [Polyangia bacterium]|nr:WGR domain-containing protein [Polyangia bacterium]
MSTREFEFREGSSDKFWKITLKGDTTTVQFGRRGTYGQTQDKQWWTKKDAQEGYEKLIAEKLKKGYVEKGKWKANGKARTPHPNPLPAARGEGTGAARGEGTGRKTAKAAPAETPAAAAPSAPAVVVSMSTERRIDLVPSDWAIATWRKRPVAKTGRAAPFDRAACEAKLLGLRFHDDGTRRDGPTPDWSSVEIPEAMSREEAHFWYLAMTELREGTEPKELVAELADKKINGRVAAKDVQEIIEYPSNLVVTDAIVPVLRHLFSESELGDVLFGRKGNKVGNLEMTLVCNVFWVLPNIPTSHADKVRALLRPKITPAKWPKDNGGDSWTFQVAALLGMHDELRVVVETWPDDRYKERWSYQEPQMTIFGLGDPALVEKHMGRLR